MAAVGTRSNPLRLLGFKGQGPRAKGQVSKGSRAHGPDNTPKAEVRARVRGTDVQVSRTQTSIRAIVPTTPPLERAT